MKQMRTYFKQPKLFKTRRGTKRTHMDHSALRHAKINCRSRWLPGFFGCSGAYGPQNSTINLSFALARAPRVWEMAGIYSFVTSKVWAVLVLYASSCEGIICVAHIFYFVLMASPICVNPFGLWVVWVVWVILFCHARSLQVSKG